MNRAEFPPLGFGVGLRRCHYASAVFQPSSSGMTIFQSLRFLVRLQMKRASEAVLRGESTCATK